MWSYKSEFERAKKGASNQPRETTASLPDGTDLLIYVYHQMPASPKLPNHYDTAVKLLHRSFSNIALWPNSYEDFNLFVADQLKNKTRTHPQKIGSDWLYLTQTKSDDILKYMDIAKIHKTIKDHYDKSPGQPNRYLVMHALLAAINAGRILAPYVETPAQLNNPKMEDWAVETLKDIAQCIDLLATHIMGLDPEITTALKSQILNQEVINTTVIQKHFQQPQNIRAYFRESYQASRAYFTWIQRY